MKAHKEGQRYIFTRSLPSGKRIGANLQEAEWTSRGPSGRVCENPPPPNRDSIPDRPARSESLYRVRYSGPFSITIGFQVMPDGVDVIQRLKYGRWGER